MADPRTAPAPSATVAPAPAPPRSLGSRLGAAWSGLRGRAPMTDGPTEANGTTAVPIEALVERRAPSDSPRQALHDFLDQARTDLRDADGWVWQFAIGDPVRTAVQYTPVTTETERTLRASLQEKLTPANDPTHLHFSDEELKFLLRAIIGDAGRSPPGTSQFIFDYMLDYAADIAVRDKGEGRRYKEEVAYLLRQLAKENLIDRAGILEGQILLRGRRFGDDLVDAVKAEMDKIKKGQGDAVAAEFRRLLLDPSTHGRIEDLVIKFAADYDRKIPAEDLAVFDTLNRMLNSSPISIMKETTMETAQQGLVRRETRTEVDQEKLRLGVRSLEVAFGEVEKKFGKPVREKMEKEMQEALDSKAGDRPALYKAFLEASSNGFGPVFGLVITRIKEDSYTSLKTALDKVLEAPDNILNRELLRVYVKMLGDLHELLPVHLAHAAEGSPDRASPMLRSHPKARAVLDWPGAKEFFSWQVPSLSACGRGLVNGTRTVGRYLWGKRWLNIDVPRFRRIGMITALVAGLLTPPWWGSSVRGSMKSAARWVWDTPPVFMLRNIKHVPGFVVNGGNPPGLPKVKERKKERGTDGMERTIHIYESRAERLSPLQKIQRRFHVQSQDAKFIMDNPLLQLWLVRLEKYDYLVPLPAKRDAFFAALRAQFPNGMKDPSMFRTPIVNVQQPDGSFIAKPLKDWTLEQGYLTSIRPPEPPNPRLQTQDARPETPGTEPAPSPAAEPPKPRKPPRLAPHPRAEEME